METLNLQNTFSVRLSGGVSSLAAGKVKVKGNRTYCDDLFNLSFPRGTQSRVDVLRNVRWLAASSGAECGVNLTLKRGCSYYGCEIEKI